MSEEENKDGPVPWKAKMTVQGHMQQTALLSVQELAGQGDEP